MSVDVGRIHKMRIRLLIEISNQYIFKSKSKRKFLD